MGQDIKSEEQTNESLSAQPLLEEVGDRPFPAQAPDPDAANGWAELLAEPETRQRQGLQWLIGAGLLLTLSLGGWWSHSLLRQRSLDPVSVSTITVERGTLEVTLVESGTVVLGGQQTLKAPGDVTVEEIRVEERQQVSAGAVLLVLRDRRLQQELQNQLVKNQQDQNVLARRREVVQERQRTLEEALTRLEESQALLDRGFISEDEYQRDQDAVDSARSELRDAEVEFLNQQLTVRNNQQLTENLQTQLADTEITSPIDAVILDVHVNSGDGVQQEGNLITIGDPTTEAVQLYLTTLNAADVRLNLPVRVSVIGPDPQAFAGRIAYIAPQAIASNPDSTDDPSKVEARAILDRPSDGALIPGSAVSVEIIAQQRQDALTIPLTAIQSDGDQSYVWVRANDGTAARREVRLGIQNLQDAEVLSGLEVGDEVVLSFPAEQPLTPGTPLEVESAL